MHEMSIASAIVELALDQAHGRPIAGVGVAIGHLRQVAPSALRFSFELVVHATPAEGATLEIQEVPAIGQCRTCGAESRLHEFPLRCAMCGGLDVRVIRGEELSVEWIDLEVPEDDAVDASAPDGKSLMMNRG